MVLLVIYEKTSRWYFKLKFFSTITNHKVKFILHSGSSFLVRIAQVLRCVVGVKINATNMEQLTWDIYLKGSCIFFSQTELKQSSLTCAITLWQTVNTSDQLLIESIVINGLFGLCYRFIDRRICSWIPS